MFEVVKGKQQIDVILIDFKKATLGA